MKCTSINNISYLNTWINTIENDVNTSNLKNHTTWENVIAFRYPEIDNTLYIYLQSKLENLKIEFENNFQIALLCSIRNLARIIKQTNDVELKLTHANKFSDKTKKMHSLLNIYTTLAQGPFFDELDILNSLISPIDFEKPDQNQIEGGENLGKLLKPEQTPSLDDPLQKAFYKELPNKQLGYYHAQLKQQQEKIKKENGNQDKIKQYDKTIKMIESEATLRQLGNAKGMYVPKQDKIYLNPKNTPSENVSVLIHELGHSILHGKKTPQKEKYAKENKIENAFKSDYSRPIKELQAELTSYTVSKQFGIDKQDSAARYIAGWTDKGQKLHDLKPTDQNKILETVTNVATAFDKTIQNSMKQVTQKTQKIQQNITQNRVQSNVQKPQAVPKR